MKRRFTPRRVAAVVLGCLLVARPVQAQTLELRFLDVGQGDAALIVTPEGKKVLVDAGPGASPVVPYLRAHHDDTLDLIVASHNHTDHIGGMTAVIAATAVRAYLVKVAHHGSPNGSTAAWVQTTRPQVAVISVGTGNTYGHPSPQVIQLWQSAGARVYRTDRDGAVIIEAKRDGSYIVLNEYSGPPSDAKP